MKFESNWTKASKHLILLTIGWFVFSSLIGLFQIFKSLEISIDQKKSSALLEGSKISSITFFIGVIVISSVPVIFSLNKKREP